MWGPRLLWGFVLLCALARCEVAECPMHYHFANYCAETFDPDLNDAMAIRISGDFSRVRKEKRLLEAYCTRENYAKLSEHCGQCPYTLTITEPKGHEDEHTCISPPLTDRLEPGHSMHLAHPMNGKEVEIVRPLKMPFNQGDRECYGCESKHWPNRTVLEGQIALTMYPLRGGCSSTTSWPHAAEKGAGLLVSVVDYVHFFYESLPPPFRRQPTGADRHTPGFYVMGTPNLLNVLALPSNATIRGRVDFSCDKTYEKQDLSKAYTTNCMHFMGPFLPALCEGAGDELCTYCEMPIYTSEEAKRNGSARVSCLHGEDLLPYRSRMFFRANYALPGSVDVLVAGTEARCTPEQWAGMAGKTVVVDPPVALGPCTRIKQLEAATEAGVRGVVVISSHPLFGRLTARMNVSVATPVPSLMLQRHVSDPENHVATDEATGLPVVRLYFDLVEKPAPVQRPEALPLPTVEQDTDSLMDEGGAVAAAVLIPILGILIVAKVLHGLHFSRSANESRLTGIPLSLGSSVLTLGCVVLLCVATYAMTQEAGSDAANSAFRNNKANMAYSNAQNSQNIRQTSTSIMVEMSRLLSTIRTSSRAQHMSQSVRFFGGGPVSDGGVFKPYSTWKRIQAQTGKAWGDQGELLPFTYATLNHAPAVALYSDSGYYWDSTGLSTDETQAAKDGAVWSDAAQRVAALERVPEGQSVPYDDPATGDRTVAQVQNGWLFDYTISDTVCRDNYVPPSVDQVAEICDDYDNGVRWKGKLRRRSTYDPMKWALMNHLPSAPPGEPAYSDVVDFHRRTNFTGIFRSRYQMMHTTFPLGTYQDLSLTTSYHTYLMPCLPSLQKYYGLFVVMSTPSQQVVAVHNAKLDFAWRRNLLTQNMTYFVASRAQAGEGVIFVANLKTSSLLDVVVNKVSLRFGTTTQTVYDSPTVRINAVSNYILQGLHLQNSVYQEDSTYVFELDQAEHYSRVSSVLMYYPLDGGVADASGERWETKTVRTEALSDGTTRTTPVAPAYAPGVHGSGLRFDGATALVVYPYLTVRVPRVWAARSFAGAATDVAEATAYRGVPAWGTVYPFEHYGVAETVDGIDGVVVCDVDLTTGETGLPYLRDRFEFNQDFSVSMYVRPEAGTGVHGASRSAQLLFSDATGFGFDASFAVFADGVLRVSLHPQRSGCRTLPVAGAVPEDEWTFLVATVSHSERRCRVFADGRLVSEGGMSVLYEQSQLRVQNYTIGEGFVGVLDEVRVHNRSLDEADAAHLFTTYNREAHDATQRGEAITTNDISVPSKLWTVAYSIAGHAQTLMIPSEDITRESAAITQATQLIVQQQEDNTDRRMSRKNDEAVLVVTMLALVVMLLFLLLNDAVTRPFTQFARIIHHVAYMRVVSDDGYGVASPLMEIRVMSRAMKVLVHNITEYKSYMPHSMLELVQTESELDSDADVSAAHDSNSKSIAKSSSDSARSSSGAAVSHDALIAQRLRAALAKKRGSFAVVNLQEFNRVLDVSVVVGLHARYVEHVVKHAEDLRGVPEQFCGDRVYVFFNGAKACSSHVHSSLLFGHTLSAAWKAGTHPCQLNVAVTTGEVWAGNLGAATMRRYSCVGASVTRAFLLERYGRTNGLRVVTDSVCHGVMQTKFVMRHHSFVQESGPANKSACVLATQLLGLMQNEGAEWMYELAKADESNPHHAWNCVVEAAFVEDYALFREKLSLLSDEGVAQAERLVRNVHGSLERATHRVVL